MTPSNKRMHATRDTTDVIERNLAGGRVMRSVRCLGHSEEFCWMKARMRLVAAANDWSVTGRRGWADLAAGR
jgi:hypothetical protein